MITSGTKEIIIDVVLGIGAVTLPLALFIAWLDLHDWRHNRHKIMVARAMTRIGWSLSIGSVLFRAQEHQPPIEHGPVIFFVVFSTGLLLSCFGMLGVARNYRSEQKAWNEAYDRGKGGETDD